MTQSGWKRWLYGLTPEGFSHKVRLTVSYIHRVLDHYQGVRQTLREQLDLIALNEETRVAIYGTGEFAELIYLGLKEIGIDQLDLFGSLGDSPNKFLGLPVRDTATLNVQDYDRVILALLEIPEEARSELRERGATGDKLITFFTNVRGGEDG